MWQRPLVSSCNQLEVCVQWQPEQATLSVTNYLYLRPQPGLLQHQSCHPNILADAQQCGRPRIARITACICVAGLFAFASMTPGVKLLNLSKYMNMAFNPYSLNLQVLFLFRRAVVVTGMIAAWLSHVSNSRHVLLNPRAPEAWSLVGLDVGRSSSGHLPRNKGKTVQMGHR